MKHVTEQEYFEKLKEYNAWKEYYFSAYDYDLEYEDSNPEKEDFLTRLYEENKTRDIEFRALELHYYLSHPHEGDI